MKKITLTIIIFLLFTCICPAEGPARLLSLGRVTSVLPDRASVFDLYEAGFTSAILDRKKENIISLSPRAAWTNQVYNVDKGSRQFVFDFMDEKNNYINCWLSNEDVLVVKPYYYYQGYVEFHSRDTTVWNRFFGMEIQYSTRPDAGVSAGAMIRYAGYSKEMNSFYSSPEHTITAILLWASKIEFMADVSMKLSEELTLAFSGGHRQGLLGGREMLPGNDTEYAFFNNHGSSSGNMTYRADPPMDTKLAFDARGINLNAGVSYRIKGLLESLLTLGVVFDRSYTGAYTYYSGVGYDSMKGNEFDASLKCRYYAGENLIFALSASGMIYDYIYHNGFPLMGVPDEGKKTDFQVLACTGVSYTDANFSVPLEFFLSTGPFSKYEPFDVQKYAGARLGFEYKLPENLALRAGCSWPFLLEKNRGITSIYDIEATLGVGYKNDVFDIGLGAGYTWFKDVSTEEHVSNDKKNLDVRLDVGVRL